MINLILVAMGGAFGACARYLLGLQTTRLFGPSWPYGTFAANVVGGLAMGILAGVMAHRGGLDSERWRLLLGVGVLGGFTTFSSFSLETVLMIERRAYGQAGIYMTASVILSILALFAGLMLTRRLLA
jgi:CrcB protein